MSYTDIPGVKLFLFGNANASCNAGKAALLNSLLTQTKSLLDHLIGDQLSANRTFLLKSCDVRNNHVRLMTRNITAIVSIDGTAYTGVRNTEYFILEPYNSKLYIKDYYDYITSAGPYYPIVVTSGYTVIPEDLKLLQNMMIAGLYATKNGQAVESYKLGDRSVSFRAPTKEDALSDYTQAQSILALYELFDYV